MAIPDTNFIPKDQFKNYPILINQKKSYMKEIVILFTILYSILSCGNLSNSKNDYSLKPVVDTLLEHKINRILDYYNLNNNSKAQVFTPVWIDSTYLPISPKGFPFYYAYPNFELLSADKKLLIGFSIYDIKLTLDNFAKRKQKYPNVKIPFNQSENYKRQMSGVIDTSLGMVYEYPKDSANILWNADNVILGETSIDFFNTTKYKGIYDRCKILMIHKDNIADLILYYWYKKEDAQEAKQYFEKAKAIISFHK